jgi:hypothetical protein
LTVADTSELRKQEKYAKGLVKQGFDFGLAVGSAFVESMRNTYYKHTGTALDELVDNSIEAGASNIHVALGYEDSEKKPMSIAVIDDGHGMVPEMIRLSVLWGGTHREGSRQGFGRFGFGLPSASVNQARRFSVFSRVDGGQWHHVTVDLDDIRAGKYTDKKTGRVVAPETAKGELPAWVTEYVKAHLPGGILNRGSVVVWEKLDRIKWKTTAAMTKNLLEHFGVTYRNYLSQTNLYFNAVRVEPTDPLFITPGYRYYDLDEDRAEPLEPAVFHVASKATGEKVPVRIRYARLPLSFFRVDKKKDAMRGNQNPRFSVMAENFGIIVCRMGRQIDVIEKTPWARFEKFGNDDRYWAAEIDFPAELDEELTVSNSKQGVVLSDRFWDLLQDAGMENALRQLRAYVRDEQKKEQTKEPESEKRPSEQAMEESEKFKRKRADVDLVEREKKAKTALEQHVKRKMRDTDRDETDVRKEVEQEATMHPYRVEFERMPGAPFYRVEQIGGMQVLYINRAHRFFGDIYAAPDSTRRVRAALEVLLFSLGDCELDAQGNPDRAMFYAVERQAWSETLSGALEMLSRFVEQTEVVDVDEAKVAA